jgi:hypothetical protein
VESIAGAVPYLEFGISAYREPLLIKGDDGKSEWVVDYTGACLEYPSEWELDASWKASTAFSFLALVVGGGGTLFVWCSTCFVFSRGTWKWTGYELLFAAMCQAIAFVWFNTSICRANTCSMFWGSKADIMASSFWFISAVLVLCRYPVPTPLPPIAASGDGDGVGIAQVDFAPVPNSLELKEVEDEDGLVGEPVHPNAEVI